MGDNLTKPELKVDREHRQVQKQQRSFVIWMTGLSGSGKSAISTRLEEKLLTMGLSTMLLDGDILRSGLNKDLDFSDAGRKENLRRASEVAKLFVDSGVITVASFISPCADMRKDIRDTFNEGEFIEVFVDCPLEECIKRDPKGLYKKAIAGEIENFTGISSKYDEPTSAEMTLKNFNREIDEVVEEVMLYLRREKLIKIKDCTDGSSGITGTSKCLHN